MFSHIYDTHYQIEVGENQNENDKLIRKSSQKSLWFHLYDAPSPHGILTSLHGNKPTKDAIKHIASIIKEKSKAKNNHRVKIEYIELSHVRTTETAGKVIVTKTPKIIII
jgi:predicted ribosome quality control (RQC) complex YloA/Tae2 family protein